jgi:hypothetical protein
MNVHTSSYFDCIAVLGGNYAALALAELPSSALLVAYDRRHYASPGDAEKRKSFAGWSRSEGGPGRSRRQTAGHDALDVLHMIRNVLLYKDSMIVP